MNPNESPLVVTLATPSIKQQLVEAGIGLAISGAVLVITVGALAAAGYIGDKIADRKAQKELSTAE